MIVENYFIYIINGSILFHVGLTGGKLIGLVASNL